jgi:outer membrane immunogenic protein
MGVAAKAQHSPARYVLSAHYLAVRGARICNIKYSGVVMKNQFIAALALTTLASGWAMAADIPVKAPARVAGSAFNCAAGQFGGGYIGVNGGAAYHTAHRTDVAAISFRNQWAQNSWGGTVGGHVGYNWTTCSTVWGVEFDGAWASNNRFRDSSPADPTELGGLRTKFDGLATARLRSGVALDSMLLYVTGGVAAVHLRTRYTHEHTPAGGGMQADANIQDWRWGWVAGFGTEWAWTRNWSFRSEVLYIGTPDKNYDNRFVPGPQGGAGFAFTQSDAIWISRVGITYRWNAPVVARY